MYKFFISTIYLLISIFSIFIPICLAYKTRLVVVKTIVGLTLFVCLITFPIYFLSNDTFVHLIDAVHGRINHIDSLKDLSFLFYRISFFLVSFSVISTIFSRIGILQKVILYFSRKIDNFNLLKISKIVPYSNRLNYYSIIGILKNKFFLILIHIIFLSFYIFIYLNKLGIVGIEAERLPFKLSGIIYYLANYVIPSILLLIYFSSRKSFIYILFTTTFCILFSLFTLSKGTAAIFFIPVMIFHLYRFEFTRSLLFLINLSITFTLVNFQRNNTYFNLNGINQGSTSFNSIIETFKQFLFSDNSFIIKIMQNIQYTVMRFDNVSNFLIASSYNAENTIGASGFLLRLIYVPLVNIEPNIHHLEWQGYLMPKGLFHIGGLVSNFLIVYNTGILNAILFAFLSAIILTSSEIICVNAFKKYGLFKFASTATTCLTLLFFARSGVDKIFLIIILPLLLLGIFPKFFKLQIYNKN